MVGFQGEAENKRKVGKLKVAGLLVELVMIKEGRNLVEEKTLQKVEKEDVDQPVLLVKTIQEEKGEEENELERHTKRKRREALLS